MTAEQFVPNAREDISHRERTRFFGELYLDEHLEQQVAQFLTQLLRVSAIESFERLVRLLEEIGSQRLVGLHPIPGAATGPAEGGNDVPKRRKRGRRQLVRRHVRTCLWHRSRAIIAAVRIVDKGIGRTYDGNPIGCPAVPEGRLLGGNPCRTNNTVYSGDPDSANRH